MQLANTYQEDLERSILFHGHLCAGQVIGTRLARLALKYFEIENAATYRDLIAVVECDRCLADAIIQVAACNLGRRRLKWHDMGKMAASFYDIQSGKAIRISTKRTPQPGPDDDIVEFFNAMSDDELFTLEEIALPLTQYDLPGKSKASITCDECGEKVSDTRFLELDGSHLCRHCAGVDRYYEPIRRVELTGNSSE